MIIKNKSSIKKLSHKDYEENLKKLDKNWFLLLTVDIKGEKK